MASEIRANKQTNRVGLGTVTYTDTGIIVSGIVTANSFKGDGSSLTGIAADKIFEGNTEVETIDTGSDGHIKLKTEGVERIRVDSAGNVSLGKGSASSTNYGTNFQIHHDGTSGASIHLTDNNTGSGNGDGFHIITSSSHAYLWQRENANMVFGTQSTARWIMYGSNGNFMPNVDSTYDIGENAVRVRNVYADTYYGSGANLTNLPPSAPVGGASTNTVFFENDKAVAVNYQVTSTKNAMSAGPIAINAGIAVTVPSGCAWTIV